MDIRIHAQLMATYCVPPLDTLTRQHIVATYTRHSGNKARTARALGIGRRTLYRLLEKYGISEGNGEHHN